MIGGNTPSIVLKRMLRYFLKAPLLRKYYNFKKEFAFLIKNTKAISSASAWWGNTKPSFRKNARTFSKSSTSQENIRISKPKKRL